jgi:iron(III) transport system permease protein
MPAVAVALLAVFIVVIKELPATLILSPVEFDTLATRIWGLTEDAYFAAASPAILTLLALATAGLLLRPDVRLRGKR